MIASATVASSPVPRRSSHPSVSNCVQKITEPLMLLDSMISRRSRAVQRSKQEFVQYEKAHFVVSAYRFLKGPLPMGNRKFPKQIRKPDISYTEIASTCRHAKGIGAPNRAGARTVFPMVWGFNLPRSSSPMVNARMETASTKPTFKESWERRRCIVPASYYFEWEHLINAATGKAKTGDKYMIQPKGSAVTWLAGLYRIEDISGIQVPVFTVLTREPSEEIRYIHDRMPVILPGVDIEKWINPDSKPDEIIKNAITDMVFEKIIA